MTENVMKEWKRVETLVSSLENYPDAAIRETARDLLGAFMTLHARAIAGLMEALKDALRDASKDTFKSVDDSALRERCRDPEVSGVLLLHGLHPESLRERVEQALEKVRPSLHSHRGDVELLDAAEGRVRLRLSGTCNGCPSSTSTFRNLLETAIQELAPEVDSIEVEGMAGSSPERVPR